MVRKSKCLSPVKGRRLRVTRLDGCGRPVYGEDSQVVTKGFVTVNFTANTTESDEINVPNAAGEVCIYEPGETSLVGYGLEIQFCNVDPDLLALVTGQEVVLNAAGDEVIGFDIDTKVDLANSNFAMELWTGASGGDACSSEGSQGNFGYILMGYLRGGILGDFTVENGAVTFTVTGANTRDGNSWGKGPYNVITEGGVPAKMPSPITTTTAMRVILVDLTPPEAMCGARPLLDPSLTTLTAIVGAEDTDDATGMTAEFTTTPTPSAGPVWYDFGDESWDYIAAPGTTSHEYKTAGTYTVKASQNGEWVETTVTVPFP